MTTREIRIGDRFKLVRAVERFPSFVAEAGMTGTVAEVSDTLILGKMDQQLEGAEEWDNCIQWHDYGDPDCNERLQFEDDTQPLAA